MLELTGAGMLPDDIAVLVRGGAGEAEVAAQVLEDYGVPVGLDRRTPFGRTRLGAGVLAAARAASGRHRRRPADLAAHPEAGSRPPPPTGSRSASAGPSSRPTAEARATLARLDEPGSAEDRPGAPAAADEPLVDVPTGDPRAAEPGALRDASADLLAALDRLADAASAGAEAFLDAIVAEADSIWTAPHRRAAAVLDPDEAADARAAAALRAAAGELRGLAVADPTLVGSPSDILAALADVPVRAPGAPGAVLVADPLEIRARRFRAVFVCGLQEGAFPQHPVPEPFLDDAARAASPVPAGSCCRGTRTC